MHETWTFPSCCPTTDTSKGIGIILYFRTSPLFRRSCSVLNFKDIIFCRKKMKFSPKRKLDVITRLRYALICWFQKRRQNVVIWSWGNKFNSIIDFGNNKSFFDLNFQIVVLRSIQKQTSFILKNGSFQFYCKLFNFNKFLLCLSEKILEYSRKRNWRQKKVRTMQCWPILSIQTVCVIKWAHACVGRLWKKDKQ